MIRRRPLCLPLIVGQARRLPDAGDREHKNQSMSLTRNDAHPSKGDATKRANINNLQFKALIHFRPFD
jgi:hypothetical protein